MASGTASNNQFQLYSRKGFDEEQRILESYFQTISQFGYERAKESLERERLEPTSKSTVWNALLPLLLGLSTAEKQYSNIGFFEQKWFASKKDSLKLIYTNLSKELSNIVDSVPMPPKGGKSSSKIDEADSLSSSLDRLLAHVCIQLVQYIAGKQDTIEVYIKLQSAGASATKSPIPWGDLVLLVDNHARRYSKAFHHPLLAPVRTTFTAEVDCLEALLRAQMELSAWRFLPSLLRLQESQSKLDVLSSHLLTKDGKKSRPPALYQWYHRFKMALLAKFSIYFYQTLSEQTTASEMAKHSAKNVLDFHAKLTALQKRADSSCFVCLLLADVPRWAGHGYHLPGYETPALTGMDKYPCVLSLPRDTPQGHWPNVVSLLTDKRSELSRLQLVEFYDTTKKCSYYLTNIEDKLHLLVVVEAKVKDSTVSSSIQEIANQLRLNKLISCLKPTTR